MAATLMGRYVAARLVHDGDECSTMAPHDGWPR
jgi:hypothetical protein